MKKVGLAIILVLMAFVNSSFSPPGDKINWISFEELQVSYASNPKPVLIDLYTTWCGWCKEMNRTTYRNKQLVDYVNKNYYAVKFNAESKKPVVFNDETYEYNSQRKTNNLAVYLTGGVLEYPTTVFMISPSSAPAPLSGYMKAKEMEGPIRYFAEADHSKQTFIEFNRSLKTSW